jgi:cytochrome c
MIQSNGRSSAVALAVVAIAVIVTIVQAFGASTKPPALYTKTQATAGAKVYTARCEVCHGAHLEGVNGPPLVGHNIAVLGEKNHLTVGDFFQFITQQMPLNAPGSLSHADYVNVLAYLLQKNGYPAGSKPLTYSGAMKSSVRMTSVQR